MARSVEFASAQGTRPVNTRLVKVHSSEDTASECITSENTASGYMASEDTVDAQ